MLQRRRGRQPARFQQVIQPRPPPPLPGLLGRVPPLQHHRGRQPARFQQAIQLRPLQIPALLPGRRVGVPLLQRRRGRQQARFRQVVLLRPLQIPALLRGHRTGASLHQPLRCQQLAYLRLPNLMLMTEPLRGPRSASVQMGLSLTCRGYTRSATNASWQEDCRVRLGGEHRSLQG